MGEPKHDEDNAQFDDIVLALLKEKPDGRLGLWLVDECYRYYVKHRRANCTSTEIMDLWIRAPLCTYCQQSEPGFFPRVAEIYGDGWETDILIHVGGRVLKQAKKALRQNRHYAFLCRKCRRELRPWAGDEVYVEPIHVEEHFGIPTTTPGKKRVSKKLRSKIIDLYDRKCFGCNKRRRKLHIDHVQPQSLGGDSAFRNLQPLCEKCGQKKGNKPAEEVKVYTNMYFEPYPSDAYEGLFW
jgi:5-methylcytosine-specific restriction endonuclease McrA